MFKAYFDETGITKEHYCTVGGYVADVDEWDRIEGCWKFVLGEFNVPYFHALEFYSEDKHGFYKGWKAGKRRAFIDALFDCLKERAVSLFGAALDVPLFRSLTKDERCYMTGGQYNGMKWIKWGAPETPYYVPFQMVLITAATYIPPKEVLYPVMSRQDQYKMHALELYDGILASDPALSARHKLAEDMVFSNPKRVVQLQAADLGVFWLGRIMRRTAQTGTSDVSKYFSERWELLRLAEKIRLCAGIWNSP